MNFWLKMMTDRIVLVLSRLSSTEKQLEYLQNLNFFIIKLMREIKLNGRLKGPNDRIKGIQDGKRREI